MNDRHLRFRQRIDQLVDERDTLAERVDALDARILELLQTIDELRARSAKRTQVAYRFRKQADLWRLRYHQKR